MEKVDTRDDTIKVATMKAVAAGDAKNDLDKLIEAHRKAMEGFDKAPDNDEVIGKWSDIISDTENRIAGHQSRDSGELARKARFLLSIAEKADDVEGLLGHFGPMVLRSMLAPAKPTTTEAALPPEHKHTDVPYDVKWLSRCPHDVEAFGAMQVKELLDIFEALYNASEALVGVKVSPRVRGSDPVYEQTKSHAYIEDVLEEFVAERLQALYQFLSFCRPRTEGDWEALEKLVVKFHAYWETDVSELQDSFKRLVTDRRPKPPEGKSELQILIDQSDYALSMFDKHAEAADETEMNRWGDQRNAFEKRIIAYPCETVDDAALKARFVLGEIERSDISICEHVAVDALKSIAEGVSQ